MIELLVLANVLLTIADAWTTRAIIKRGGSEMNPSLLWLASKLLSVTGARWAWLAVKSIVVFAVIAACWRYEAAEGLIFLAGWYGAIIFINYLNYRRQNAKSND